MTRGNSVSESVDIVVVSRGDPLDAVIDSGEKVHVSGEKSRGN